MRKAVLYSRSPKSKPDVPAAAPQKAPSTRYRRVAAAVVGAAFIALLVALSVRKGAPVEFDPVAEPAPVPSAAAAYEAIRKSVVRVRGFVTDEKTGEEVERSVGTGVVILENGTILTNLHVVAGAKTVKVTFEDGLESEAVVTGTRPEHDLAVLVASPIPDDLPAATLRGTADLVPGDQVVAVGFPFGIGPSVSSGVVSGLGREYRSPEGERILTNLIQFDAAVNPGNSGGPLVTASGEVVGIVTGMMNPTEQRVFIGIGFAVPIENAALAVGVPPF